MTIASLGFIAFAAFFAVLYNLGKPMWWRQGVFLAANLTFLATFSTSAAAFVPFAAFLLTGLVGARLMQTARGRKFFWPVVLVICALFFWLKRYTFIPPSLLIAAPYVTIGLSYIFFRALHVIIDTREEALPERIGTVAYFNYLLNFTSLASGPIQLYQDYAASHLAAEPRPLDWVVVGNAIERLIIGFFKVIVLGAILWAGHERSLAAVLPDSALFDRVTTVLAATASYTLFLYCNFSGSMDIVIGVARFFRLDLPENFDRPFSALNFIDFWSRWHITLSNWLKVYVYNPLLKVMIEHANSEAATLLCGVIAFFITFFLIGLWHGQTSEFAVYGVFLGAGVSINKIYQTAVAKRLGRKRYRDLCADPLYQAVARGFTFTFYTFSLVWFWGNWETIHRMTAALGLSGLGVLVIAMTIVATVVLALGHALLKGVGREKWPALGSRYVRTVSTTAIGMVTAATLLLMATPAPDLVYKNF